MIETKQVQIAKEVDEVFVFLIELDRDLKAKKSITDIAAENLPALMQAMSGLDQIDDEVSKDKFVVGQTAGYRLGELTAVLLG
jgi:hypothetical protein